MEDDIVLDLTAMLQVMSRQCRAGVSNLSDKYEHGLMGKAPQASEESAVNAAESAELGSSNKEATKPEQSVSIDPKQAQELNTEILGELLVRATSLITLLSYDVEDPAKPGTTPDATYEGALHAVKGYLEQMKQVLDSGEKRS